MQTDNLTTSIKQCEKKYESIIGHDKFLIIRIDGHKFSKFTKKFKKPFDFLLSSAMENTTKDLIDRFGGVLGYTQSDEITLVFNPSFIVFDGKITNNQIFAGRTQKIASLFASFASIKFNYWLNYLLNTIDELNISNDAYSEMVAKKIGTAYFDARVFGVPTEKEAALTVLWRYNDAIKNSKSMFAQAYCSHKSLLNKTGNEQINLCLQETGNDWYTVEDRYRFGIFVKKEKYVKPVEIDGITQNVERTRILSFSKQSFDLTDENISFVIDKYC